MQRIRNVFLPRAQDRKRSSSDLANSGWMLGDRVVRLTVGLLVGAYIARYLGTGDFGVLSYVQSILAILLAITAFGLNPIVVRKLVNENHPPAETLGAAMAINMLGCVLAGAGAMAVIAFAGMTEDETLFFAISSFAILLNIWGPAEAVLQARMQYRLAVTAIVAATLISAAIKIALIYWRMPLVAFAYSYLIEHALISASYIFAYLSTEGWRLRLSANWDVARDMVGSALPVLLSSTVVLLFMRVDQIMIRQLMDVAAVGVYSAAIRLAEAWYFIPTMLTLSLYPSILKARQVSEAAFEQRMRQLFNMTAGVAWAAIVVTLFLADALILLLFGDAFAAAAQVLKVLAFGGLFVSVGVATSRWYLSSGWERRLLYRVVVGLFVNIALNLVLIPLHGLPGAAWATAAGYAAGYWLFDALRADTYRVFQCKTRSILIVPACIDLIKARYG